MSKGKLIKVCGECANYDWKKHRCKLGCNEGEPQEPFYTDCPLPTVDTDQICKQSEPISCGHEKGGEWISVDERLPDSGEHCLVSCTVKRCDGTLGQYICVGYYAEKFKHLAYGVDDDCVSEYNEENDEFYISEGWYEVIKNWDDYGFVAIDDFVTHWMPLPEPPKGV